MDHICFLSSYPPRNCGIAEFNQDLIIGLKTNNKHINVTGIAINESDSHVDYKNSLIKFQIRKNIIEDYIKAGNFAKEMSIDTIIIQLEFALYGGYDGKYILKFIKTVAKKKKIIVIVHGSPINSYSRKKITRKNFFLNIEDCVSKIIVINPLQKKTMQLWKLKTPIVQIWHGAPDGINNTIKGQFKYQDNLKILNFGLFHKKKGLEYLIKGFQLFIKEYKHLQPKLFLCGKMLVTEKHQGYLEQIISYIKNNHLTNDITVINKFFERKELYLYLKQADIVVYPYTKRDLVSSGPLSFSVEAKKFIITTPFPYAKQLLSKQNAYFTKYNNAKSIYQGLKFYVENPLAVKKIQNNLNEISEEIKWSNIAKKYLNILK